MGKAKGLYSTVLFCVTEVTRVIKKCMDAAESSIQALYISCRKSGNLGNLGNKIYIPLLRQVEVS